MTKSTCLPTQQYLEMAGLSVGVTLPPEKSGCHALVSNVSPVVQAAFRDESGVQWKMSMVESRHGLSVMLLVAHAGVSQIRILANLAAPSIQALLKSVEDVGRLLLVLTVRDTVDKVILNSSSIKDLLPQLRQLCASAKKLPYDEALVDMCELAGRLHDVQMVTSPDNQSIENVSVITILEPEG